MATPRYCVARYVRESRLHAGVLLTTQMSLGTIRASTNLDRRRKRDPSGEMPVLHGLCAMLRPVREDALGTARSQSNVAQIGGGRP
jgi:hypothetical protein